MHDPLSFESMLKYVDELQDALVDGREYESGVVWIACETKMYQRVVNVFPDITWRPKKLINGRMAVQVGETSAERVSVMNYFGGAEFVHERTERSFVF